MRERLVRLDATFLGHYTPKSYRRVRSIDAAQGVLFQCPKCAEGKKRRVRGRRGYYEGAHMILCWFRNPRTQPRVPDDADPKPGRWWITPDSTSLETLTFDYGEPHMPKSVLLTGGCGWHGFIEHGDAFP